MSTTLISQQRTDDQRENDERRRVVRFRENENPEQAFHFRVTNRIFYPSFAKTFEPQKTGVASSARETFRRWIITTVCEREIDIELDGFADDFGFGKSG